MFGKLHHAIKGLLELKLKQNDIRSLKELENQLMTIYSDLESKLKEI